VRPKGPLSDYLLVVLCAALWGSAGVFVRRIGLQGQEMVIVFWRMAIGTAFVAAVIAATRRFSALRPGPHPWLLLTSGVLLSLHWMVYFKSIHLLPVSTAVFIAYLAPVLVALSAPLFLGEALERRTPAALALALGGVAFLSWGGGGRGSLPFSLEGMFYALLTACSYAALVLMLKKLRRDTGTLTITFFQSAVGTVAAATLMPFQSYHIDGRGWAYLFVLGVALMGFTGLLYVHAARRVKAQHLGIISYVEPLSAIIYGWLLLDEPPTWWSLAGGLLIVGAGALVFTRREDDVAPLR
jgi:drug/metabolite transporter (DMT)-like permease